MDRAGIDARDPRPRRPRRAGRARHRDRHPQREDPPTISWRARSRSGRDRYLGFAHLPMQDAKAAADELERCVRELKFCGAMINGHTNGQYLDHPLARPVLGARRGAGHADLSASGRSGDAGAGAGRPQGPAPRHLGMDVRDRLARPAPDLRRRLRPLPGRQARTRPSGRDPAVPARGASTAAPDRISMLSSSPSGRRNTSRTISS